MPAVATLISAMGKAEKYFGQTIFRQVNYLIPQKCARNGQHKKSAYFILLHSISYQKVKINQLLYSFSVSYNFIVKKTLARSVILFYFAPSSLKDYSYPERQRELTR